MAKKRISVEEAKNLIVEYLKENGSANINELYRIIGCGKQTIYDALNRLESEGKVKDRTSGNRRVISLVECVPTYLKVLTGLTVLCFILFMVQPQELHDVVTVSLYSGSSVPTFKQPSMLSVATLFTALILTGYWFAAITLKWVDIVDSYYIVKKHLSVLYRKIEIQQFPKSK